MTKKPPHSPTPRDQLDDLLFPGIAEDFFEGRQALALLRTIEQHGPAIDAAKFGLFFGSVRLLAARQLILALTRLYEPPNDKHPTRSLPAILQLLEVHSGDLTFEHRDFVEAKLATGPFRREALGLLEPAQFTRLLVGWLRAELPQAHKAAFHKSSKPLSTVKMIRDKVVAHNERVDRATLSWISLDDAEALLQYVEDAIALVGFGYLSIMFEMDNGDRPFLKDDPARVCLSLERLLRKAKIIPDAT